MKWVASKASNIALIKYMGKKDTGFNQPVNPSLSWTLNHLLSHVQIEESKEGRDRWQPIEASYPFSMSVEGEKKFLGHFQKIKDYFSIDSHFIVSSGNNFPADCGIASSASSFAALTEVACLAFTEMTGRPIELKDKAILSSKGSGSSCRSFYEGWVLWQSDGIYSVQTKLNDILHMVVIAGDQAKKVSSSRAHQRVKSSLLFPQRAERAQMRLDEFQTAMETVDWPQLFQIAWEEFWDMHGLFETSRPQFGYFLPSTIQILSGVRQWWEDHGDGPLLTMDAGPNVHLLWRGDQREMAIKYFNDFLKNQMTCLSSIEEVGFAKI